MKKHYFLGLAGGYSKTRVARHVFAVGRRKDCDSLVEYLGKRYEGDAILYKNGRSALAAVLEAYFEPGDAVIVNGFTCYAVYEAIKCARLKPIWADIDEKSLNFTSGSIEKAIARSSGGRIKGVIVQNSLGNPVDMIGVERLAKQHGLKIIEDLAHSVGVRYIDGREAGAVGAGVAFSFGKDKSVDTVSGGAAVFRDPCNKVKQAPSKSPKPSDHMRARFYPLFGAICRGLTRVHLGGVLMRVLVKIRWVERSADNKLDLTRRISKFEAKLALEQFRKMKKNGEPVLRSHYLVQKRKDVLAELRANGYYFDGLWYERPVSPERYYRKVHFPEKDCPVAVKVAESIVNLPNYYSARELAGAKRIINEELEGRDE